MNLSTQVPDAGTPIFDAKGYINPVWHNFFNTIMNRTGGTLGIDAESDNAILAATADPGPAAIDEAGPLELSVMAAAAPQDDSHGSQVPSHGQQNDPGLHDVVTITANGFMSAADKAKLDSVVLPTVSPAALVADVVTQNSTADGPVLAFVMPASSIAIATTISIKLTGLITSAAAGGTLSVWVKSGATKVITQTFTLPAGAQSNVGLFYNASISARTIGASGTMQIASLMTSNGNALNAGPLVGSVSAALNTTVSNTFTIGWNWSVATAGNIATAKNATFSLEKQ
jgi:hypothetical protein